MKNPLGIVVHLAATHHASASLRFHEREHFRVIQKPELGRPFPVRAHNRFVSEDNHSANGKLVNVKALPCFDQRRTHEFVVAVGRGRIGGQPSCACARSWSLALPVSCQPKL